MPKIFSYLLNYIKCPSESRLINFTNIDITKIVAHVHIHIHNIKYINIGSDNALISIFCTLVHDLNMYSKRSKCQSNIYCQTELLNNDSTYLSNGYLTNYELKVYDSFARDKATTESASSC